MKQVEGIKNNPNLFFIVLFIFFAALSRLIPHPPNFTAVGAIAVFGGAYFNRKWLAWIVPVIAVWFTDILLNNIVYAQYYEGFVLVTNNFLFTATALVLIVLLAQTLLKKISVLNVFGASIGASAIFFLVSNFGVWLMSAYYPANIPGLLAAYTAGLPFFLNTLAGDLFYCTLMFGSFAVLDRYVLSPATKTA